MQDARKTKAQLITELEVLRQEVAGLKARDSSSGQLQEALQGIAAGISATTGEAFFRSLVQHLAQTLEVDYAFVSELAEGQSETVSTTAAWAHGKIVENFHYELANTPCEHVVGKQLCVYHSGLQQLFPYDLSLVEMGVESYVGMPLFNSQGRALGLLAVMHSAPLCDPQRAAMVLQIFAVRAAAELERQRAEAALRESEEKFRTLSEQSPNMVFINQRGRVLYANQKCEEILGYRREEFYAADFNFLCLIAPEFIDVVKENFKTHMEGKEVPPHEYALLAKDGKRVDVILSTKIINYENDRAILGIMTDITARKRAEDALRDSEQRYRLLFEHNPHPMWVFDVDTLAFLAVNDAAVHHYGYAREEFLTMTLQDIRPPEDIPRLLELWRRPMSRGLDAVGTWRHRKKDGTVIDVDISTHPLTFAGRRAELVLAHDVTERKRAEEERQQLQTQLFQAQKLEAIGTLAGGIAHDFNNMLSAIMGFTELAADEVAEDSLAHRNLEEVLKASHRAKGLVQQILTFSRPGQQDRKPIQLRPLLEETLALLRVSLPTAIEIRHHIDTSIGSILANPTEIQQVLMNLCVNATQAMKEQGGVLEVGLRNVTADGGSAQTRNPVVPVPHLRLTVSDTGCGMTAEVMEHIFEPFFTTKPVGEGSGLGLAIAHSIVTAHGGAISVQSHPGRGTTFHIDLPLIENSTAPGNFSHTSTSLKEGPFHGVDGEELLEVRKDV